jgi:hypothetical protein
MQIEVNGGIKKTFGEVQEGDVFCPIDSESLYCMKVSGSYYDDDYNAVDLRTGQSISFLNKDLVKEFNAKLIIINE